MESIVEILIILASDLSQCYNLTNHSSNFPSQTLPPLETILPLAKISMQSKISSSSDFSSSSSSRIASKSPNLSPNPLRSPINPQGIFCGNFMRRPRGEKRPIPEEQKDEKYFERRKRNNEAAKKSRDARKMREDRVRPAITLKINYQRFFHRSHCGQRYLSRKIAS